MCGVGVDKSSSLNYPSDRIYALSKHRVIRKKMISLGERATEKEGDHNEEYRSEDEYLISIDFRVFSSDINRHCFFRVGWRDPAHHTGGIKGDDR
jgi:hypothetical protein